MSSDSTKDYPTNPLGDDQPAGQAQAMNQTTDDETNVTDPVQEDSDAQAESKDDSGIRSNPDPEKQPLDR